jgi:hypothetical protein
VTRSSIALIEVFTKKSPALEFSLSEHSEQHPDTKVVFSLLGLGTVLGSRDWESSVMTALGGIHSLQVIHVYQDE